MILGHADIDEPAIGDEAADPALGRGERQEIPLLTSRLIKHAACNHSDTEIVARGVGASLQRSTWGALEGRARRVANMLGRLGVRPGERIATLAWNRVRHLELLKVIVSIKQTTIEPIN